MNQCIKCGKEIPAGELFCLECSLNPGSSLFDDRPRAERLAVPVGRMQTPAPVKRVPVHATAADRAPARKKRRGLVAALVIVSLLLAACVGLGLWQYGGLVVERHRLQAQEEALNSRQAEIDALYEQLEDLTAQLDENKITIAAKEQEIQDLTQLLAETKSSQNQGAYDLTTAEQEMERLSKENEDLQTQNDALNKEIDTLKKSVAALEYEQAAVKDLQEKADFLDTYVVFVENDGSKVYHTYDCTAFSKRNFWAYSRKLAESQGYTACPTCGGTSTR